MLRVHLTRDAHARIAMFQALAHKSIGSRKYRTFANATDNTILSVAAELGRGDDPQPGTGFNAE